MYHNHLNSSLAPVDKEWLLKVCDNTISCVMVQRKVEDEKSIDQEIKEYNSNWFNKLFGGHPLSREAAAERLKEGLLGFFFPSQSGGGSVEVANKLKRLANNCVDNLIYISSQDLSYLVI